MITLLWGIITLITGYIGYKTGKTLQQTEDLNIIRRAVTVVCDDYDLPEQFTDRLSLALQVSLLDGQLPVCACGSQTLIDRKEHLQHAGIIHTLSGCDYQ